MEYFNFLNSLDAQDAPDYDRLVEIFSKKLSTQDLDNQDFGFFDIDLQLESLQWSPMETDQMQSVVNVAIGDVDDEIRDTIQNVNEFEDQIVNIDNNENENIILPEDGDEGENGGANENKLDIDMRND